METVPICGDNKLFRNERREDLSFENSTERLYAGQDFGVNGSRSDSVDPSRKKRLLQLIGLTEKIHASFLVANSKPVHCVLDCRSYQGWGFSIISWFTFLFSILKNEQKTTHRGATLLMSEHKSPYVLFFKSHNWYAIM